MTRNLQRHPLNGRLVVVGGQCSKVGKTALVIDLIRSFSDWSWTAVKMTPHASLGCPVNGAKCGCGPDEHAFAIRVEQDASGRNDTARYINAGAKKAIWAETKERRVADALGALGAELGTADPVVIESNAIVEFWRPNLFFMVLDPGQPDFAASARAAMRFVDAFVFRSPAPEADGPTRVQKSCAGKPIFVQLIGEPLPRGVQSLARQLMSKGRHPLDS